MSRSTVLHLAAALGVLGGVAAWVAADDAAGAPEFLFGSVVLLTAGGMLRLAVRSARRAAREHARAGRLASTGAAEVARTAVAVERARLAGDVQAVVRTAATTMGTAAEEALRHWDDDPAPALRAVQEQGARAGTELRRLLGLLREAHDDTGSIGAEPVASLPRLTRRDVVLAAAATLLATAESIAYRGEFDPGAWGPLSVLLTAAAAATLLLRRTAPELGAVLCGLVFATGIWTQPLSGGFWILLTPGVLTWAAVGRGPRGLLAVGALAAGMGAEFASRDPDNVVVAMLTLVTATVGSALVRLAEVWGRSSRARADERAAELDAAAEEAVRAERLAVARELHDLVSHAVGVMVMQAGAALATRGADPERARRALDVVRLTAGETLEELDRLVDVLGSGALGAQVLGPDGDDLPALVERLRAAGLDVRAEIEGELSGEVGAVVHRVVQESLTNVLRHAPGASATVRVRAGPTGVEIEVADDGPGPGGTPRRGYGLVGIEERIRRLGGDLDTGAGPDGRGFRVHARVPSLSTRPA